MRRILIFSLLYYPNQVGGAEIAIKEITDRISDKEIEFDMITLRNGKSSFEKMGNVNIYRIGPGNIFGKLFFPIIGTIKTFSLLSKNHYDNFWAMMVTFSSGVPYIINILRILFGYKEIPIILTLQEGDSRSHIEKKRLGLIGLSWLLALKRTDKLTVISKYLFEEARRFGYKGSIEIIPNGVDIVLFSTQKPYIDLELLKQKLGKKSDDVLLITTSRLVDKNAVEDIIDSLTYLPSNVKLLILGQGHLEEKLKEKVEKLDLKSRVTFLGYIPHSEMPQYLHISDIFIRPALSEGFGNSYIEAMAAGIPVIATPVGGIIDFLRDGETGLFCDVQNPKSIAQKIEKLIKDKESRDYIVKNALEMVKEKYQWNLIANDMKNRVFLS